MALNPQNTKFKNNSGQYLLKALFWETNSETPDQILYTLKDEDYKGFPSLRRLYLETNDETEYVFASRYFYSWEHWKKVSESSIIKPSVEEWREELQLRILNASLNKIKKIAEGAGRDAFAAQKYLIEKPWLKKPVKRVGRPDKVETPIDTKLLSKTLEEDLQRITAGAYN